MQYEVPDADHIGINVFNTSALRAGAILTMQLRTIILSGPQNLTNVGSTTGLRVRAM